MVVRWKRKWRHAECRWRAVGRRRDCQCVGRHRQCRGPLGYKHRVLGGQRHSRLRRRTGCWSARHAQRLCPIRHDRFQQYLVRRSSDINAVGYRRNPDGLRGRRQRRGCDRYIQPIGEQQSGKLLPDIGWARRNKAEFRYAQRQHHQLHHDGGALCQSEYSGSR